jgi:membrane fusion protein, macrolide-specific efflux system
MNRNKFILVAIVVIVILGVIAILKSSTKKNDTITFIHPVLSDVEVLVSTTGVVEPQNRLEVKPSISGRIESILVKEGTKVEIGDILAWMSSTERAALIDAARGQGNESLQYWEDVYKKTPIISPIKGEVIVRSVEPGQTVTTADSILVLSNRLVVNAQFDETDVGRVNIGAKAFITLDAYPEIKLTGTVDHIAYESELVNNVIIYEVDIIPDRIPEIMRSGMSVTVEVVEKSKTNVLTIPSTALHYEGNKVFVFIDNKSGKTKKREIVVGLNNDKIAEVVSGVTMEDSIIVQEKDYLPKMKSSGSNPFMPFSKKKK